MACPLATERVWFEKSRYHDAEKDYFEHLSKLLKGSLNKKNTVEKENDDVSVNHQSESASGSKLKKTKKSKQTRSSDSTSSITQAQPKDDNKEVVLEEVTPKIEAPSTTEKENVKNEEAKSKKKKKKKNNNKDSEKSQDTVKNEGSERQSNNQQSSQERQKTNHKNKTPGSNQCTLVSEIAKARQHIKNSLERMDGIAALAASPAAPGADVLDRLALLEKENTKLKETVEGLRKLCLDSQNRIKTLESRVESLTVSPAAKKEAPKPAAPKPKEHSDNDDDGVDLFGSDEEEEDQEAAKIREQRLAEYNAKKSKKPALIAKSSVLLDVKPWDDETDLKLMEAEIRKIQADGLLWGASKFVPVAFGIQKIVISCVVEDDKVSIDWLTEEIEKIEDYVQSVDVAAFNKI